MSSHQYPAPGVPSRQYRFGDFTLDADEGFLRRGGEEVALRPKALDALIYLVERRGKVVAKGELIDAIWRDTAVTDNSLAQCLLEIRRALGDDSHEVIRTIARRGYMFAAPVATSDLAPARPSDGPSPEARAPGTALQPARNWNGWKFAGLVVAPAVMLSGFLFVRATPPEGGVTYTQLTKFTDSATSPAVSPDGRMIAFIRGASTFLDEGQLYVKLGLEGEPVQLTHDDRLKMGPVFSPDGSRIAYTVYTESGTWETWTVSVLGGEPQRLLANAAALSWIGDRRVLFSEIKRGLHMAVVSATDTRSEVRDVYVPSRDRMAHRSAASPDGRWVLIASEMNSSGWLPCRVVPMDGSDEGKVIGPPGAKCTHAVWSPDGRWMYFSAEGGGGFHTWRQRFPDGRAEQVTFGATDEEGIAMSRDGRSFVSSVGTTVSSIWVHDEGTERQVTFEGYGHLPSFSPDGRTLYYLLRVSGTLQWAAGELWAHNLATGKQRRILAGTSMAQYDVSGDGSRVAFARTDRGSEGVWVARTDGQHPPVQISSQPDTRVFFGSAGTVIFEDREGQGKYLFRAREDGSNRQKVTAQRIINLESVSPDRRWALVWPAGDDRRRMVAYPLDGGDGILVCEECNDGDGGPGRGRTPPALMWSMDGRYMYARFQWAPSDPLLEEGKTYVFPLERASALPPAFNGEAGIASFPRAQVIPRWGIFPGPRPSLYAYTRATTHRNLFRISLP